MTTLITLISWGWTITYDNLKDKELTYPLMGLGLLIHIVLGGFTFVGNDMYHKYHDY